MLRFPRAGVAGAAAATLALGCLTWAAADDFVDLNCSGATAPVRVLTDLKAHLPQPLGRLLDAAHSVAHEYQECAESYRSAFQLENMNYALVQEARVQIFAAELEGKYNDLDRARADLHDVIAEMQVVAGYKNRAKDPGPDQNAAGAQVTLEMQNDGVPSTFERPAKILLARAQELLGLLNAMASPAPGASPAPQSTPR